MFEVRGKLILAQFVHEAIKSASSWREWSLFVCTQLLKHDSGFVVLTFGGQCRCAVVGGPGNALYAPNIRVRILKILPHVFKVVVP